MVGRKASAKRDDLIPLAVLPDAKSDARGPDKIRDQRLSRLKKADQWVVCWELVFSAVSLRQLHAAEDVGRNKKGPLLASGGPFLSQFKHRANYSCR